MASRSKTRRGRESPIQLGAAVLALGASVYLHSLFKYVDVPWVKPPQELSWKLRPEIIRAVSFGFWPAAIDLAWLRVLQDEQYQHVAAGVRAPIFSEIDLITDLDPAFFE